ncbi:MAG TPA: membrane dipeptidase [Polyangiaceae bacterium]|jgi:membrane dipeptidase
MSPPVSRRDLLRLASAVTLAGCGTPVPPARAAEPHTPRARSWYDDAVVIDTCGGFGRFDPKSSDDPSSLLTALDLTDARQSGVTAYNWTIDDVTNDEHAAEHTFEAIGLMERELAVHADTLLLVRNSADLRTAKATRRSGLILGFQGATALGPTLERLNAFVGLGVRIMQLTYNVRNLLGDGCLESANAGLSAVGRQAVERMNDKGVLIDLSHCGQRTTAEAIELSKRPVAITHTGCAALVDRPRNKRDEEMRKCAEKGGVVGIYCMPFLRMQGQPTSEDVVAHIEHALQVCGEDHVSIGTDGTISPIELTPEFVAMHHKFVADRVKGGIAAPGESPDVYNFCLDLNTPRRFQTLGEKLLARGHKEERIKKILGGNFARLFGEVCG